MRIEKLFFSTHFVFNTKLILVFKVGNFLRAMYYLVCSFKKKYMQFAV